MKIEELGKHSIIIDFSDLFTKSVTNIHYKQGEIGTSSIKAKLVKKRFPIDLTNCRVVVNIITEKGEPIVDRATILEEKEGIVEFKFEQIALNAGTSFFELTIVDENYNTKKSPKIAYRVLDSFSEDAVIESERFPILVNMIKEVDDLHTHADNLVEETTQLQRQTVKLNEGISQAESVRETQEGIRQENEMTRQENEIIRQENETARIENVERISQEMIDFQTSTSSVVSKFKKEVNDAVELLNLELNSKANDVDVVKKGYGTLDDFDENTRRLILGMDAGEISAVLGEGNVKIDNLDNNLQSAINKTNEIICDFSITEPVNLLGNIVCKEDTLIGKDGSFLSNNSYFAYVLHLKKGTYIVSEGTRNIFTFREEPTGQGFSVSEVEVISNVVSQTTIEFTLTEDKWVAINFMKTYSSVGVANLHSTEVNYRISKVEIPNLSNVCSKNLSTSLLSGIYGSQDVDIVKEKNEIYITSKLNDKTIRINAIIDKNRNNCFNFSSTEIIDVDGNSQKVHSNSDDIAPIRTFYTIGANHGYPCFSLRANGQSQNDVGSVWTNGSYDYVLVNVDDEKCTFLYPAKEDSEGIVSYIKPTLSGSMIHKNGATNTNDLDTSSVTTTEQFYPSVNNHSIRLYCDNEEITEDGNYKCNSFNVVETYNIMCFKGIQDFLKNNIGCKPNDNRIQGALRFTISYKFTKGAKCFITHGVKALKKVDFGMCGFLQSVRLSPQTGDTVFRYMPNVKPKSGIDFKSGNVNMNTYNTSLNFTREDLINISKPPNRYVDTIINNNDEVKCKFTMGYIPDIYSSSDEERLKNSEVYWDMRNSKKSYPVAQNLVRFEAGDYKCFAGYRCYLLEDELTNFNAIDVNDNTYIFIDAHTSFNGNRNLEMRHIGKKVTVLDSENFVLYNDIVDYEGINFNIDGYGYAILKI